MEPGFLRFLNLEFWYCVIYSIFGGRCASVAPVGGPAEPSGLSLFFDSVLRGIAIAWEVASAALHALWSVYSTLAYSVSGMFALSLISTAGGLIWLRYTELKKYGHLPPEPEGSHGMRGRWDALLERAMSTNPKEWREGILAADDMLGELLGTVGYKGEGTSEKLKGVSEGAFVTLPAAWEAHRVRNFVSEGQSNFILTQREAFRVMKLYEQVFEEFKFV